MVPATIAWDACECGTLAIAAQRFYLTMAFPTAASDVQVTVPCRSGFLAADLVVQVLRCAPQPVGTDLAPSCDALSISAEQVSVDAWTVMNTVQCLLDELRSTDQIVDYLVRNQLFAGPAGGCVGSELSITIAVEQAA